MWLVLRFLHSGLFDGALSLHLIWSRWSPQQYYQGFLRLFAFDRFLNERLGLAFARSTPLLLGRTTIGARKSVESSMGSIIPSSAIRFSYCSTSFIKSKGTRLGAVRQNGFTPSRRLIVYSLFELTKSREVVGVLFQDSLFVCKS